MFRRLNVSAWHRSWCGGCRKIFVLNCADIMRTSLTSQSQNWLQMIGSIRAGSVGQTKSADNHKRSSTNCFDFQFCETSLLVVSTGTKDEKNEGGAASDCRSCDASSNLHEQSDNRPLLDLCLQKLGITRILAKHTNARTFFGITGISLTGGDLLTPARALETR